MKEQPKLGFRFERRFVVRAEHLIPFADDRMPAVLATPRLIGEMEMTAREAVAPFLDANERTVGIAVDVTHLAPGLEGSEVVCAARVLGVQDGEIVFQIEARDSVELLSRGIHRRKVVDVDRLRKRVDRKRQGK